MNPETFITMSEISYSYDNVADSNVILTVLKNRSEVLTTYQPVETVAQKTLHGENPALKELWDQYVIMCSLCRE